MPTETAPRSKSGRRTVSADPSERREAARKAYAAPLRDLGGAPAAALDAAMAAAIDAIPFVIRSSFVA